MLTVDSSHKNISEYMDNVFLFDWLTFTSKKAIHDVEFMCALLGMDINKFQSAEKGRYGYSNRLYCGGISILTNGFADSMGICVEMSGSGCRDFETYGSGDWNALFSFILRNDDVNITRIDLAYDVHDGSLDFDTYIDSIRRGWYVSPWKYFKIEESSEGISSRLGHRQSEMYLRCYDKAAEQCLDESIKWYRIEMVLKRDRAYQFVELFMQDNSNEALSRTFWGVLNHYVRFVVPTEDSNKSRWPVAEWWDSFLRDHVNFSIFVAPGVQYGIDRVKDYVYNQAGNSIITCIFAEGLDGFLEGLIQRDSVFSEKFRDLCRRSGLAEDMLQLSDEQRHRFQYLVDTYNHDFCLDPEPTMEQLMLEGFLL